MAEISRRTIVAEALNLLNEVGLDEVSLRRLASRLGVKAPSLYWYVEDKAALLGLMSETVFQSCLDRVPPCDSWQSWLRAFGLSLFSAQNEVRDCARLIMIASVPAERVVEVNDTIVGHLARFGLDRDLASRMQASVQMMITGWSACRAAPFGPWLDKIMVVNEAASEALDTLIAGWEVRLLSETSPLPTSTAANY